LTAQGVKINFAHRTFRWSNEGGGVAAVHCVIIGFGLKEPVSYRLFDYIHTKVKDKKTKKISTVTKIKEIKAKQINPYLVDAPTVLIANRSTPLCNVPKIGIGNKPIDNGNYLFTTEEKAEFITKEPASEKFFKRWLGADEFLNGYERWCLWLGDVAENELAKILHCSERVAAVKEFREASKSEPTRKIASTPTRFHVEFMPKNRYLVVPKVSSENRLFIPIGFIEPETLSSDLLFIVANAEFYNFGILSSSFHNAWNRTVCGRLGNGYRYSAGIVYNNFPFPVDVKPASKKKIEDAAHAVLDARILIEKRCEAAGEKCSLATMYGTKMPEKLVNAHKKLDAAVDSAYSFTGKKDDAARVAFLFEKYQELTALAVVETKTVKKKSTKS
jgi:hypothetical protein